MAFLTGAAWILLALAGLVWRRRRSEPRWELWDALRGVRILGVVRDVPHWLLNLTLLGDGYRLGVRARASGDTRASRNLAFAELATTRSVLEQLRAELAEHKRSACVLQAAWRMESIDPGTLRFTELRRLVVAEQRLSKWLGTMGRLRLHLMVLHTAVRLLARRVRLLANGAGIDTLDVLPAITADTTTLTRATMASREALSGAWRASRARLGFDFDPSSCERPRTGSSLM